MISVVVPVYRAARYVEDAVRSALDQPEVSEVLLIEDGSPDGSLEICRRLEREHSRVRMLRHPGGINRGAGPSRNLGIEAARTEWVGFLDADDGYCPGRFARDVSILAADTSLDGVYGVLANVPRDGFSVAPSPALLSEGKITRVEASVTSESLFESLGPLGRRGHFHLNTLTVRKSLLARTGLFPAHLELSQDTHLCLRLAALGRLVANGDDNPVAWRGVHGGNRISDTAKLMRLRTVLFESLFEWSVTEGLCGRRRFLLWDACYRFTFDQSRQGGETRSAFFWRGVRTDPALAGRAGWWGRLLLGAWSRRERRMRTAGRPHTC